MTGQCLQILTHEDEDITAILFLRNGILLSATDQRVLRHWDPATGQCLRTTILDYTHGPTFSQDGMLLAEDSFDVGNACTILLWDMTSGRLLHELEGNFGYVRLLVFSNDTKILASAHSTGTVKVWDTASGECRQTLKGQLGPTSAIALSENGSMLALASKYDGAVHVRLWDLASVRCLPTSLWHTDSTLRREYEEGLMCTTLVFVRKGRTLLSAFDRGMELWDSDTGQCLWNHNCVFPVTTIVPSKDLRFLASVHHDGSTQLWDAASMQPLQVLKGRTGIGLVGGIAFSQNGLLASASECCAALESGSGTGTAHKF
jgi:WD40 repeat protein